MNKFIVLGVALFLSVTPVSNKGINKYFDWTKFNGKNTFEVFVRENQREKNNIANNKRDGDVAPNTWNIGDNGKWVAYDSNSNLIKGLIFDKTRDCYFLMNLDNGDMVYENGFYLINDKLVYLTFNSTRVGVYGSLSSGVDRLKDILK